LHCKIALPCIVQEKDIIEPNYDSPPAKLFTETAIHNFLNEESFACLSFADPSFSTNDTGLPSWVPMWSTLSRSRRPCAQEAGGAPFNAATRLIKRHQIPTVRNETYRFVVEAYVYGLMNGEIFDFPNFEERLKNISLY
jgi:hypothetical protein